MPQIWIFFHYVQYLQIWIFVHYVQYLQIWIFVHYVQYLQIWIVTILNFKGMVKVAAKFTPQGKT